MKTLTKTSAVLAAGILSTLGLAGAQSIDGRWDASLVRKIP